MTLDQAANWILSQVWHCAGRPQPSTLRPLLQFLPDGSIECALWGAK